MSKLSLSARQAIEQIPYVVMLLSGVFISVSMFYGGFIDIDVQLEEVGKEGLETMTVLHNTLSYEINEQRTNSLDYSIESRRAVLPVEIFSQEKTEQNSIGYKKKNKHCYIPGVSGLDGETFAVVFKPFDTESESYDLECRNRQASNPQNPRLTTYSPVKYSPVILRGSKGAIAGKVGVYRVR